MTSETRVSPKFAYISATFWNTKADVHVVILQS